MMGTIESLEKDKCTGCYGCYNACPNGSISFNMESGFFYPSVNFDTCINCNRCVDVCPVLSPPGVDELNESTAYAAWSNDEKTRIMSSSGGVFSEFASVILNNGGLVYGASFDDELNLRHNRIKDYTELSQIRGSKYVQSQINGVYNEIVDAAKSGISVLFCGTPCQVSALKNLISIEKVSQHVYTCDLICHGVASQSVFKSYIQYLEEAHGSDVVVYSFRDKSISWDRYGTRVQFENGETVFNQHMEDPFMIGYLRNYFIRPSCMDCIFCRIPRVSDITLGDYWGVPKDMYDPRGVSAILCNNDAGAQLLEQSTRIMKSHTNLENIKRGNPRLINGKLKNPDKITQFNEAFKEYGFKGVENEFLSPTPAYMLFFSKVKDKILSMMSKLLQL